MVSTDSVSRPALQNNRLLERVILNLVPFAVPPETVAEVRGDASHAHRLAVDPVIADVEQQGGIRPEKAKQDAVPTRERE